MPRRRGINSVKFHQDAHIQLNHEKLYQIEFKDNLGESYVWTPWDEVRDIFLEALQTEGENTNWESIEIYGFWGAAGLAIGILKAHNDEINYTESLLETEYSHLQDKLNTLLRCA